MRTRVVNPLRTGGLGVPTGQDDPTRFGYSRQFVMPYQHDIADPGGSPGAGYGAGRRSPATIGGLSPGVMARNPGYGELAARNAYNTTRQVPAYTGSPGENPTGAGLYANAVQAGGLMNNSQAGASYANTGYMPGRTVGGLYGKATPMGRSDGQIAMESGRMAQYAPTGMPGLMAAPTTQGGYAAQMDQQNPGGRFFGGALPALGLNGKPGWFGAPTESVAQKPFMPMDYQGKYQQNAAGQIVHGGGWSGKDQAAMDTATKQFDARRGGLLQRQEDYQARTGADMADRNAMVKARGIERGQGVAARARMQRGQLTPQDQMGLFAMQNPALAMQAQLAQGQIGLQAQLASQQSSDRRYVADQGVVASQHRAWGDRYQQAIKDGNTPDDAMRLAGPPPGQAGGLVGPPGVGQPAAGSPPGGLMGGAGNGGYKPKKPLLDAQTAQLAGLPKEKREAALRGMGVTDPQDLHHYQSQLDPTYNAPGWMDRYGIARRAGGHGPQAPQAPPGQLPTAPPPDPIAAWMHGMGLRPWGR